MKKLVKRFIRNISLKRRGIVVDINSDVWISEKQYLGLSYPVTIVDSTVTARTIGEGCRFYKCACYGNASFGRFTSIFGSGTVISSILSNITIGSFCSIGQNVNIQDSNHRIDKISSYFMGRNIFGMEVQNDVSTKGDVIIEDDVWIGSNSVVLSGVTIGRGSVIGAGSVVTTNIPPYSIAVGAPARVIKQRFANETVEYLESLQWWNWPIEKLRRNKELFFIDIDKENTRSVDLSGIKNKQHEDKV